MIDRTFIGTVPLALLAAAALAACVAYPYQGAPPSYAQSPYYYDYYYYPHADVYFQLYTGEYYYRSGGSWRRSRSLPNTIYLDGRNRSQLRIPGNTPYGRDRDRRSVQRAPGPSYQRNPTQNREARRYNERRHEEYRQKYGR
ncbi:MAG: hypothetical protein WCC36_19005 [Gammaproteobacteria bacterium]